MTIGQFARRLNRAGLDCDARDLADLLWLAQFIKPVAAEQPETEPEAAPQPVRSTSQHEAIEADREPPAFDLYADQPAPRTGDRPTPAASEGLPFSVPAAPTLRTRLDLARSLRPLMRKVPSRVQFDLDEAATVTQIAETRVYAPVVQPRPERWLDLDLVVEAAKTTVLWERAIAELQHLLEYQGAFRTVRTWRLTAAGEALQLFPRWRERSAEQRPHSPRELLDPGGRRLILLASDCTSALWGQGKIHETLWEWSDAQPLAVVQMLPERLWQRTALSDGHIVRLSALTPGLPNARLEVEGLPALEDWEDEAAESRDDRVLVLPIVTLDAAALRCWARVVAGAGDTRSPGRAFELALVRELAAEARESPAPTARTARQRLTLFQAIASPPAQKLAGLMAVGPVSLPVIDLLRAEFLPEAQQAHVAEVLLSGLLRRCDTEDSAACHYEFWVDETGQQVRDLLIDTVPIAKAETVLNRFSALIARKAGLSVSTFEALLAILQESADSLGAEALPFARVGLGTLRRLGGRYKQLAERYEQGEIPPGAQLQLVDFEYEGVEIEAVLKRFEFETATIARETVEKRRWLGLRRGTEWVIRRRHAAAWGYTEALSEDVNLEMVAIPAGRFQMGAPESEPESLDDERPQHQVAIPRFYLGRYPVTKAQWRVVAGYPQVERELKPNPARFRGYNRPFEQVSWDDAVEFCQRLSARTGREYRLPSEAEWEYACRAGTETPFHFGETITTDLANYDGNFTYNDGPKGDYRKETTEVGQFPANAWGLHDLHGNVWEWCEDDWHDNYAGAPTDGSAWVESDRSETGRLLRGGSWNNDPRNCRSAFRGSGARAYINYYVGFRVACVPARTLLCP